MTIDLPSIACVADAWKQWAQEKPGAREGDTRVPPPAPVLSFTHYFQARATQAIPSIFDWNCPFGTLEMAF